LIKYEQGDYAAALKVMAGSAMIEKQAAEPQLAVALYIKVIANKL